MKSSFVLLTFCLPLYENNALIFPAVVATDCRKGADINDGTGFPYFSKPHRLHISPVVSQWSDKTFVAFFTLRSKRLSNSLPFNISQLYMVILLWKDATEYNTVLHFEPVQPLAVFALIKTISYLYKRRAAENTSSEIFAHGFMSGVGISTIMRLAIREGNLSTAHAEKQSAENPSVSCLIWQK